MGKRKLFSGPGDRRIARALVIAAHPDDLDFFAAGTALQLTRRGVTVDLVLVTSGDKGSRDGEASGADLAAAREREQRASAARLGIEEVRFLGHRDAAL